MPDTQLSDDLKLSMYRQMLTIRRFEERCNALYMQGKIPSTLHLYNGQEAVAVGVCAHLSVEDTITSTHRPHGHAIAKGVSLRSIMAELYAKDTGCCRGKGGSMHVGDVSVGMLPAIAIVGAGIPVAAGVALACKQLGNGRVAVSFFGEGATNEGAFHEALNMATIWRLPAVFVCENNLYAASTPVSWTFKVENVADRAAAYGLPGEIVDGNDVLAVYEAAGRAVERARTAPARPCWSVRPTARSATRAATPAPIAAKKRKRSGRRAIPSRAWPLSWRLTAWSPKRRLPRSKRRSPPKSTMPSPSPRTARTQSLKTR